MKRLILTITLLLILLNLTSCAPITIKKIKEVDSIDKGKVSDIEFKVGTSVNDIEKKLGTNYKTYTFDGGAYYMYYEKLKYIFICSYEFAADNNKNDKLWGIFFDKGYKLFGVTVGDTADQIKEVLGKPTKEYYSNPDKDQDQLEFQQTQSLDEYILEYSKGNYTLEFIFESKNSSSVFTIYHLKK